MTQPVTTQSNDYLLANEFSPARLAFGAALTGGTCAVVAGLLTIVSPLGGAIFGISSFLSGRLIHWICDKVNCCPDSIIFKVTQFATSLIGGVVAGSLMTTVVGFPITIAAGAILTVASTAVTIAAALVLGGCLCSSAVATGMALGTGDSAVTIQV